MNCKVVGGLSKALPSSGNYLNNEFATLFRTNIDIRDARQAWSRNAGALLMNTRSTEEAPLHALPSDCRSRGACRFPCRNGPGWMGACRFRTVITQRAADRVRFENVCQPHPVTRISRMGGGGSDKAGLSDRLSAGHGDGQHSSAASSPRRSSKATGLRQHTKAVRRRDAAINCPCRVSVDSAHRRPRFDSPHCYWFLCAPLHTPGSPQRRPGSRRCIGPDQRYRCQLPSRSPLHALSSPGCSGRLRIVHCWPGLAQGGGSEPRIGVSTHRQ